MDIEKLKDEAAMFLEEMHVSGDAMIDMDHCLDELSEEKQGAYYLHDLMTLFFKQRQETRPHETIVMCSTERRIKELEEIADSDCMCSRHVFCDACDASRGLNEIKQEIRKLHGRLCT